MNKLGSRIDSGTNSAFPSHRLSKADLLEILAESGATFIPPLSQQEMQKTFTRVSAIGRSWRRDIAGEHIHVAAVDQLIAAIEAQENSVLLAGTPGSGKTCVLLELQEALETSHDLAAFLALSCHLTCFPAQPVAYQTRVPSLALHLCILYLVEQEPPWREQPLRGVQAPRMKPLQKAQPRHPKLPPQPAIIEDTLLAKPQQGSSIDPLADPQTHCVHNVVPEHAYYKTRQERQWVPGHAVQQPICCPWGIQLESWPALLRAHAQRTWHQGRGSWCMPELPVPLPVSTSLAQGGNPTVCKRSACSETSWASLRPPAVQVVGEWPHTVIHAP